jgi:thiol-disulfide isomerase/thioredoxin
MKLQNLPDHLQQSIRQITINHKKSSTDISIEQLIADAENYQKKLQSLPEKTAYFLITSTQSWLEKCESDFIPKLEELAAANNVKAQLILFKIHSEKFTIENNLSRDKRLDAIKIALLGSKQNILIAYKYLLTAAFQDDIAGELLIQLSRILNNNPIIESDCSLKEIIQHFATLSEIKDNNRVADLLIPSS